VVYGVATEPGRHGADYYEGENLVFPVETFANYE
jgi:hypothetical protein